MEFGVDFKTTTAGNPRLSDYEACVLRQDQVNYRGDNKIKAVNLVKGLNLHIVFKGYIAF